MLAASPRGVVSPLVNFLLPVVTMGAVPGKLGIVVATALVASGMVLMHALCVEDEPPPPDAGVNKDKR